MFRLARRLVFPIYIHTHTHTHTHIRKCKTQIEAILGGLPSDYSPLVTSIISHLDPYSVEEREALLLAVESCIEHCHQQSQIHSFHHKFKLTLSKLVAMVIHLMIEVFNLAVEAD